MERQVKERLIGAAVLVAAAVVLVPEMFSGSATRARLAEHASSAAADETAQTDSSTSSGQLKTYRIQLQEGSAPPPASAAELPAVAPAHEELAASSASSDVSSVSSSAAPNKPTGKPQALAAASSASSKAPESKPTSVSAPPRPVSADGKGWVVQIGSFGTDAKAKQIVGSLKAHDFPAYLGPVTVNGKTLYRVRVGPLGERSVADALLKKLKGGYPDASVLPAG